MSLDDSRRLHRRWLLELWNGDLAVADRVVTPDFVGSWPGQPGLVHGPGELAETITVSGEAVGVKMNARSLRSPSPFTSPLTIGVKRVPLVNRPMAAISNAGRRP